MAKVSFLVSDCANGAAAYGSEFAACVPESLNNVVVPEGKKPRLALTTAGSTHILMIGAVVEQIKNDKKVCTLSKDGKSYEIDLEVLSTYKFARNITKKVSDGINATSLVITKS